MFRFSFNFVEKKTFFDDDLQRCFLFFFAKLEISWKELLFFLSPFFFFALIGITQTIFFHSTHTFTQNSDFNELLRRRLSLSSHLRPRETNEPQSESRAKA